MSDNTIAFLFPGQGSQFVGMGKEFMETDESARSLMAKAGEISGYPLEKLCLEGPMEELTRTAHLQPAVTVLNLICLNALRNAGVKPDFVVGHSLGEYAALCGAGVLSPEDTLHLVTERGRLMEREANLNPGVMHAILGMTIAEVMAIVAGVKDKGVITAANHNSEKQIVVSGEAAPLDAAAALVAERGGRAIPLKVSGAWHSDLVAGAVADFSAVMGEVEFKSPQVPLIFNVTAAEEHDPAVIRSIMSRQISSTVKWFDIMNGLLAQGVRTFVEVGPKNVLSGLTKKIIPKGYDYRLFQVDTPEAVEVCSREL
ncbi:MAG: ACP S-malonyltransferase [Desulfobulbaceae bacterium]|nr:ACP S-malonyltransferase [Desulfobulbaceae bacterium]